MVNELVGGGVRITHNTEYVCGGVVVLRYATHPPTTHQEERSGKAVFRRFKAIEGIG